MAVLLLMLGELAGASCATGPGEGHAPTITELDRSRFAGLEGHSLVVGGIASRAGSDSKGGEYNSMALRDGSAVFVDFQWRESQLGHYHELRGIVSIARATDPSAESVQAPYRPHDDMYLRGCQRVK